LYEFRGSLLQKGPRTGEDPLQLVIVHIMHQRHFSDILRYVWPFAVYIIMKALNGFLMIQRQMTLKVL